ncbi:DNRLRE domain-containing protein [Pontibacter qinzhouensis]|nr:DNRLRE domain-containing protein [Pontibacter qinzhouensis]
MLYRNNSNTSIANTNYYNQARNLASAWTVNGQQTFWRTLFKFNLSNIPSGSTITSATLYLYSDPTATGNSGTTNNQLSGSNAIYFEKVVSNWGETSVTWNNQPGTTTSGRIWQGPSTSTTENIQVNVTSFVQDWVNAPSTNYGMRMALENEVHFRGRSYGSEEHTNTTIRPKLVVTYTSPSGLTFTQETDQLFQHLNKTPITTGILYDRVVPFTRLDLFGQPLQLNTADREYFRQAYSELRGATYGTSSLLSTEAVDQKIRESLNSGTVPIGLIAYKFNQIDTMSIQHNLLYQSNGLLYDSNPRSRSPYWEKKAVVLAALTGSVKAGVVNFRISPDLVANNLGLGINYVQIDFGNGAVNYSVGQQFSVSLTTGGVRTIRYTVYFNNNTQVTTYSTLTVASSSAATMAENAPCGEAARPIESDIPFRGYDESVAIRGVGDLTYYYKDCNTEVLNKPVIILDGFDPGDDRKGIDIYDEDLLYDNRTKNFGRTLRDAGYDVIILNFPENKYIPADKRNAYGGADFIERSAMVLVKLIREINKDLTDKGSTEQLIIMGPSMGGLISRYALAYMEQMSSQNPGDATWNHRTKLWISFDSPHLGANIPIGDQYFLDYFATKADNDGAKDGKKKLDTPAARQMLVHHYSTNSQTPQAHAFRQTLLNNFVSVGNYPSQLRKIAIANGSQNGILNNSPCQKAFTMDVATGRGAPARTFLTILYRPWVAFASVATSKVHFTPNYGGICEVFDGRFLLNSSTKYASSNGASVGYDTAPGGTYNTQEQLSVQGTGKDTWIKMMHAKFYSVVATHSFIPTTSALAYNKPNHNLAENLSVKNLVCTGETPFNAYYAPANNQEHVELTVANVNFAINEILGNLTPPTVVYNASIQGPGNLCTNSTYQLANLPTGATVTWSAGGSIAITGSNTANPVNVTTAGNGAGALTASITSSCGSGTVTRNIITGPLSRQTGNIVLNNYNIGQSSSNSYYVPDNICTNSYYQMNLSYSDIYGNQSGPYSSDIWFEVDEGNGYVVSTLGNNSFEISVNNSSFIGTIQIPVRIRNQCNVFGDPLYVYVYFQPCWGPYSYAVSPNPAGDEIVVAYHQGEEETLIDDEKAKPFEVVLYNDKGKAVSQAQNVGRANKLVLNTRNLPNGMYILHITDEEETIKKQILIKHE